MSRYELKESDYAFNETLDPFQVLKRMGFTESSIYQEGAIIRVHCPIHRDLVRKSMIIDTSENTFKCQYSQCEAYKGGLLVELVAMYYDCTLEDVAKNLFGEEDKSTDLLFRGEMYINKGMHAEALPYLEQAVEMNPRNETTRCKLAALYLELGRKDDAFKEYMNAAESFAVRGELEKTLSIYNILIMLQPGAVKARKELSYLFTRMGRPDAAAEQLKWVVDFYVQYGQKKAAKEAIGSMLELDPDNPMSHFLLGKTEEEAGKRVQAGQGYLRALELFLERKETSRAMEAYENALRLTPGSPRLKELKPELEALQTSHPVPSAEDNPLLQGEGFAGMSQDSALMEWLNEMDQRLDMDLPLSAAGAELAGEDLAGLGDALEAAMNQGLDAKPETKGGNDTSEIQLSDRRVSMCLNDLSQLTPEQLEQMRQQLLGMFAEVRKTYEDGLLAEWEMRTIKEFYKAFCTAVDQYRKQSEGAAT